MKLEHRSGCSSFAATHCNLGRTNDHCFRVPASTERHAQRAGAGLTQGWMPETISPRTIRRTTGGGCRIFCSDFLDHVRFPEVYRTVCRHFPALFLFFQKYLNFFIGQCPVCFVSPIPVLTYGWRFLISAEWTGFISLFFPPEANALAFIRQIWIISHLKTDFTRLSGGSRRSVRAGCGRGHSLFWFQ